MPRTDSVAVRATERRTRGMADRVVPAAVLVVVAWGVLAFGAVYPWAYWPLVTASAMLGIGAYWAARRTRQPATIAPVLVPLVAIAVVAILQTVPLPAGVRTTLSPATEPFLRATDIQYAAAAALAEQGSTDSSLPRWPLSIDPGATRRGVALLAGFSILLAGLHRFLGRTGARAIVPAIIGLGVLVAVIGIVQKAVLGDNAWGGMKIYGFWTPRYKLTTPFGPFVNKNHYAGWMLMALPLAVGYLIGLAESTLRRVPRGWRDRLLWMSSPHGAGVQLTAAAALVMTAALAMTQSRSGLACAAVTLAVAAFVAARGRRSTAGRVAVLAGMLVLLVLPVLWADVDLASRFTSGTESVALRRQAWRDALTIVRDFPLAGTGLDTYGRATFVYSTATTDLHFQEAHNDYLQLAAEGGILIALPALAAIVACVRGVRRRLVEDRPDPLRYWIRFGAATGLAAIALQSLVEFSLQMPGNAALFVVILAIALHDSPEARTAPRNPERGR